MIWGEMRKNRLLSCCVVCEGGEVAEIKVRCVMCCDHALCTHYHSLAVAYPEMRFCALKEKRLNGLPMQFPTQLSPPCHLLSCTLLHLLLRPLTHNLRSADLITCDDAATSGSCPPHSL